VFQQLDKLLKIDIKRGKNKVTFYRELIILTLNQVIERIIDFTIFPDLFQSSNHDFIFIFYSWTFFYNQCMVSELKDLPDCWGQHSISYWG